MSPPATTRRRALAAAMLALVGRGALTSEDKLRVGLVPYLSTRAMLGIYEPLRRHLEAQLARPVEFYTAASFTALTLNARAPGQQFTMMPMHLARLATADWGFVLVARSTQMSPVALWAPRRLGLQGGAAAARGRRVAVGDPLSITTMMFRRWCMSERLDGAVQVEVFPGINSALLAVSRGEVDLVIAAAGQLRDVPAAEAADLQALVQLGSVLTPAFVAQPSTPPAAVAAFRAALLSFRPPQTGGASASLWAEGGLRDLEPYESYAAEARLRLGEARSGR